MNTRTKITRATCLLLAALVCGSVVAQDPDSADQTVSESLAKPKAEKLEEVNWSFDELPKRPTSEREQKIIDKIVGVVTTKYDSVEHAFSKLDSDEDGKLNRSEVSGLLRLAKLNRIVRMVALGRLIERYDVSNDEAIQWPEFNFAITKAIDKTRLAENQTVRK